MKTRWILGLGIAALVLVGGGVVVDNAVRNKDAVGVIADTIKSEKPVSDADVATCIIRLIDASVIHGRVRKGEPFNVWGRRFEVTRTEDSVTCRSPGILGIGGADAVR